MAFKVIFITGATASGKSAFTHRLIDKYFKNASILSLDSMQVYKLLSVGTAKPDKETEEKYRYKLVDIIAPKENFTLNKYLGLASETIPAMPSPVFAVGGTGLYMHALIHGLFEEKDDGGKIREMLNKRLIEEGLEKLVKELEALDKDAINETDKMNPRRVMRALEVCLKTGVSFSKMKEMRRPVIPIEFLHYHIEKERKVLYEDINSRVLSMFEKGLLEEVKSLIDYGVTLDSTAMQGIGYKECYEYIVHKNMDYNSLIDLIQKNTRHFAKRQITWFNKYSSFRIDGSETSMEKVYKEVSEFCSKK